MTALTIIVTPIYAACRACLLDHNVIQSGQFANKLIPYPFGEVLACWIFKPGNIVQVVVVEALVEWLECSLDVGEVHNPSRITADRTSDMDCSAKGVSVQSLTLVPFRNIRKAVRGLKGELAKYLHHGIPRNLCVCKLKLH